MLLQPTEPEALPWRAHPLGDVVAHLLAAVGHVVGRPPVLAVDGRSAGGKSTFAERLAGAVPGAAVVHTDDVAWNESFFGWDALLVSGVLEPARRGEPVRFRPPAWHAHERAGSVDVPAGTRLLVVEGVGAGRRSLAPLVDVAVWVQSDFAEAERRGVDRDARLGRTLPEAQEFWDRWMAEEVPFLAEDRPWERADLVVCGTPELTGVAHDPSAQLLVAGPGVLGGDRRPGPRGSAG